MIEMRSVIGGSSNRQIHSLPYLVEQLRASASIVTLSNIPSDRLNARFYHRDLLSGHANIMEMLSVFRDHWKAAEDEASGSSRV